VPLWVGLAWAIPVTLFRDSFGWYLLHGNLNGFLKAIPCIPIRDAMHMAVWGSAQFRRRVTWRGQTFRIGAGSRLFAEYPADRSGSRRRRGKINRLAYRKAQ